MKKILLISLISAVSLISKADTASVNSLPGTMTNIFTGYGVVTTITVTSLTSTNTQGLLVDAPTNSLGYATLAYTNVLSYITNLTTNPGGGGMQPNYTNYFGVVTTLTNSSGNLFVLVDVTNSVPAASNNWVTYGIGSAGSASTTIPSANINIIRGLWFTNTSSGTGPSTISVTYRKQ